MKPDELERRLANQEYECAYCGLSFERGTFVAVGYDNNALIHLTCVPNYRVPLVSPEQEGP